MKKIIFLLFFFIYSFSLIGANLSFSGGKSSLSLKEGKEEVTLSDGATVKLDDMEITADKIVLSGSDWRYVKCEGSALIKDESRGLEIRALDIFFDRTEQTLSIASWFEINDIEQEITAMGGSMYFDMDKEIIELSQQAKLFKITERGIMRCSSESMIFDRSKNTLALMSNSLIEWDKDEYRAEVISVDLDSNKIKLEGRIEGTING